MEGKGKAEGEKKKEQEKRGKRKEGREETEAHFFSDSVSPTSLRVRVLLRLLQVFPPLPRNHGSSSETGREPHVPQSRCDDPLHRL